MPPTPSLEPYSVPLQSSQHPPTPTATAGPSDAASLADVVEVTTAAHEQVRNRSQEIIKGIVFSPNAIASSSAVQKCLVKDAISKAVPLIISLRGLTQWPSVPKDVSAIWRGVTVVRSAMMTLARQNIVTAYDLLPPHDHDMPPDQFRTDQTHLANESWTRRTPRQSRIFPRGTTSRIFPCMHNVRGQMTFTKHKFSVDGNESKFVTISLYLNSLSEDEKMSLNSWMDHLIICGRSQQGSAVALSDFDLVFEI
ncbi:hypothetical protein EV424DRAFT_1352513 [Suillus variegatus]|nr:hypothetical protein EV424DRAFT_1352513 [Suillus variegatus]